MSHHKLQMQVEQWPATDQACWRTGTSLCPGLHRQRHADRLRPRSVEAAWKSYGRLLCILQKTGQLDSGIGPAERITDDVVALYFDALREAGNCDNTIKGRMFHLRTALHIMAPGKNFDWITRPGNTSLEEILKQEPNDGLFVPEALELFKWGLALMSDIAPQEPSRADPPSRDGTNSRTPRDHHRSTRRSIPDQERPDDLFTQTKMFRRFRNGLIIALLACRAPRLGSLASMRLGTNLYKQNGEYWVRLQSLIVKNKRSLHYSLPNTLTPYIDRYLSEMRSALLDVATTDAVWGSGTGTAFSYLSIQTMIYRYSLRRYGQSFGPHRFRHAFASSLAEADPGNPGLAAIVLGITEQVVTEHYRKARQVDAARKFNSSLSEERARTSSLAKRAFKSL